LTAPATRRSTFGVASFGNSDRGPGGGRSAIQVAEERRFQNYRNDRVLTPPVERRLKWLRRLDRVGFQDELEHEKTIDRCRTRARRAVIEPAEPNRAVVADGRRSMDPYARSAKTVFAANAATHFKAFHFLLPQLRLFEGLYRHGAAEDDPH
jgi:uncharacterized protein with von Willebrand factor type A (vWA) domain